MRYVTLQEYRTELGVPLSAEECDILRTTVPSLSIAPSIGSSGCYDITPGSVIGAVALEDLGIEIRPKIPIARVLFLLGYSIDPSRWRDIGFHFGEASSVFEAVIPGFVSQVRRATVRGLLKSYRQEEEALTTVRGRVRLDEQIRKRYGIVPPIEVRFLWKTARHEATANRSSPPTR